MNGHKYVNFIGTSCTEVWKVMIHAILHKFFNMLFVKEDFLLKWPSVSITRMPETIQ